jgi:hypothetical protein
MTALGYSKPPPQGAINDLEKRRAPNSHERAPPVQLRFSGYPQLLD